MFDPLLRAASSAKNEVWIRFLVQKTRTESFGGLPLTSKKRLVAFDMDGTLIDSADATYRCLASLYSMLGLPRPLPRELAGIHGESASQILSQIIAMKADHPETHISDVVKWANHIYPHHYMWRYSKRMPGVRQTMREISEIGYVVIISSNVGNAVSEFISKERLESYVGPPSLQSEFESKRSRLINAQRFNGVSPRRTVYVGDTLGDIEMGRELGVKTIGVARSLSYFRDLSKVANRAVRDIAEIPDILRQWESDGDFR